MEIVEVFIITKKNVVCTLFNDLKISILPVYKYRTQLTLLNIMISVLSPDKETAPAFPRLTKATEVKSLHVYPAPLQFSLGSEACCFYLEESFSLG